MSTNYIAQQLHDKATRGIALSAEEQARLETWYAQQDREESVLLDATSAPKRLAMLHMHIETALAQLQTVTQRIQELTAQNEAVQRRAAPYREDAGRKAPGRSPVATAVSSMPAGLARPH